MKNLLRAAILALAMTPLAAPAATTVTVYGFGGSSANVSLPDNLAAALIASGRATVAAPSDNGAMNSIIAQFGSSAMSFLRCLPTAGPCTVNGGSPSTGGTFDFSDAANSGLVTIL